MEPAVSQNRINEGTVLKGDIVSSGFFRVDGSIEGNISKPSKVVLGKSGVIKGTLICEDADLEGHFEGKLDVSGTLTLKSSARIKGEVFVGKLAVEPGATFNASCVMKGSAQASPKVTDKTSDQAESEVKTQNNLFERSQRIQKQRTEQPN